MSGDSLEKLEIHSKTFNRMLELEMRIKYLEDELKKYQSVNVSEEDRKFLIKIAYLEIVDKEGYVKLIKYMKYMAVKELLSGVNPMKVDGLVESIKAPVEFHNYSDEFVEYIMSEAEKLMNEEESEDEGIKKRAEDDFRQFEKTGDVLFKSMGIDIGETKI